MIVSEIHLVLSGSSLAPEFCSLPFWKPPFGVWQGTWVLRIKSFGQSSLSFAFPLGRLDAPIRIGSSFTGLVLRHPPCTCFPNLCQHQRGRFWESLKGFWMLCSAFFNALCSSQRFSLHQVRSFEQLAHSFSERVLKSLNAFGQEWLLHQIHWIPVKACALLQQVRASLLPLGLLKNVWKHFWTTRSVWNSRFIESPNVAVLDPVWMGR